MSVIGDAGEVLNGSIKAILFALSQGEASALPAQTFRIIINSCKKVQNYICRETEICDQLDSTFMSLTEALLQVLTEGSLTTENQILGSTALCLIIANLLLDTQILLECLKKVLSCSDGSQLKLELLSLDLKVERVDTFQLCLVHGLLQLGDDFWEESHLAENWQGLIMVKVFPMLEKFCYQYTPLAVLSFKVLVVWLQRVGLTWAWHAGLLRRTVNIVMTNWENPLDGVRAQNMLLLDELLAICKLNHVKSRPTLSLPDVEEILAVTLTELPWLIKYKYLLLSIVLPKYGVVKALNSEPVGSDILVGLFFSLEFCHLVSAGCDLYRVCLSELIADQWQAFFLQRFVATLKREDNFLQKLNLLNYWFRPTVKKFPEVLNMVISELMLRARSKSLFSLTAAIKIASKEGLEGERWKILGECRDVELALRHGDDFVRSQVFSLVCISSKTTVQPTEEEFALVKTFLVENVSTKSAILRHNTLNDFAVFLIRIRDSCLHYINNGPQQNVLNSSAKFMLWLQNFIKDNLQIGCNYQRKFTTLEICRLTMSTFSPRQTGERALRKSNTKTQGRRVLENLPKCEHLFCIKNFASVLWHCVCDPADNVRECAAHIFIVYFDEDDIEDIEDITRQALGLCSSIMFYKAESGALAIEIITRLVYSRKPQIAINLERLIAGGLKVTGATSVVDALIEIASQQASNIKLDLLKAASRGSPLHGVLKAIHRLATDPSSPELNSIDQAQLNRLITLMECLVQHFLKILSTKDNNNTEFAPSFREMGIAIDQAVEESAVSNGDNTDNIKLSPGYQLALNCVWTNIRVCCELSSGLVTSRVGHSMSESDIERCADLVYIVLKQCRHKGAIESAGLALHRLCQALITSWSHLPQRLLTRLLDTLDSLTWHGSISRRSAGRAIIVHRIVISDTRVGKPLLHICMGRLLRVVETPLPPASLGTPLEDLPQAQALHFLRSLAQDTALMTEMARYIQPLTVLTITHLSSPIWTIRNAALQLFGVLVSKLIGQKKRQDGVFDYHLALEDLLYHCPDLFAKLEDQLSQAIKSGGPQMLQMHSSLMPILTLLSNLSIGLLNRCDIAVKAKCANLKKAYQTLLNSEILNVRKLAAKANAFLFSLSELTYIIGQRVKQISEYLLKRQRLRLPVITNENGLHGFLLNTKFLVVRFNEEKTGMNYLLSQECQVKGHIRTLCQFKSECNLSFVSRAVLSELLASDDQTSPIIRCRDAISVLENRLVGCAVFIGVEQWANVEISLLIEGCVPADMLEILKMALLASVHHEIHRSCLEAVKLKLLTEDFQSIAKDVLEMLLTFIRSDIIEPDAFELALEVIVMVMEFNKIPVINYDVSALVTQYKRDYVCSSSMLPVICGLSAMTKEPDVLIIAYLIENIYERTNPSNFDEDVRMNAAKGLNFIAPFVISLANNLSALAWSSVTTLLQDEDGSVRTEAAKFVNSIPGEEEQGTLNPSVVLRLLFHVDWMLALMPSKYAFNLLIDKIAHNGNDNNCFKDIDPIRNPFDHVSVNIYDEPVKVIEMAFGAVLKWFYKDRESVKILFQQRLKDQVFSANWMSEFNATLPEMLLSDVFAYLHCKKSYMQCVLKKMLGSDDLNSDFDTSAYSDYFRVHVESLQ